MERITVRPLVARIRPTLGIFVLAWGVTDIVSLLAYMYHRVTQGVLPFLEEIGGYQHHGIYLDSPVHWYLGIALRASLLLSGVLLISRIRAGAIVSYIQLPFRFMYAYPTMSFVLVPFSNTFSLGDRAAVLLALSVVVEMVRIVSTAIWHWSSVRDVATTR